jgi:hypothetical protein
MQTHTYTYKKWCTSSSVIVTYRGLGGSTLDAALDGALYCGLGGSTLDATMLLFMFTPWFPCLDIAVLAVVVAAVLVWACVSACDQIVLQ